MQHTFIKFFVHLINKSRDYSSDYVQEYVKFKCKRTISYKSNTKTIQTINMFINLIKFTCSHCM